MPDVSAALEQHAGEVQRRSVSLKIRALDSDSREFTGVAVPYGVESDISGWWREAFDPDAVQDSDGAKVFAEHRQIIGKIVASRQTPEGWEVTGRISRTSVGDDYYTLLVDGAIDSLSIGFEMREYRVDENDTVVHTLVLVREVSLVPFPQYDTAKVSQIRHADPTPTPKEITVPETLTREQLDAALVLERAESTRRFDSLEGRLGSATGPAMPQFRSLGEFVKALAGGDESAATLHRAYTGGAIADAVNANVWLADEIKLVQKRRKVLETFSKGTLPEKGMNLEYAQLKSDTTKVGKQAKEGDTLVNGKIQLTSATTPVDTYGGYTELSRQVIERAEAAYLTTTFEAMGIKYSVETEAAVRAALASLITTNLAGSDLALPLAYGTYDVLDLLVDTVEEFEDTGFNLEGAYVSKDVFKRLMRLEDTNGNLLMNVTGQGVNRVGTVDVKGLSGNVAGVEFKLLPGADASTFSFYDSVAIKTFESSGAPYQLQDDNIINLTRDYSVYGYLAVATPYPAAVRPVKIAAA